MMYCAQIPRPPKDPPEPVRKPNGEPPKDPLETPDEPPPPIPEPPYEMPPEPPPPPALRRGRRRFGIRLND